MKTTIVLCLLLFCCKAVVEPEAKDWIIFYDHNPMVVDPKIARSLDIKEYQEITKSEFLVLIERTTKSFEYKITEFEK